MKVIRFFLSLLINSIDFIFRPSLMKHSDLEQKELDRRVSHLALYEFKACPFCVKVRWAIRRLGLNIKIRDAKSDPFSR